MTAHFAKVTSKAQTTLPKEVRDALGVKPGDSIVYRVTPSGVSLAKAEPINRDYLRGLETTLSEWSTAEDAAAFDDL
jgi:AbrB family looped-hinge helix DNA binding protein